MKYLIVGMGNIGPEYELTRHNIGFLVADNLADQKKAAFESGKYAFISSFKHKGRNIYLIKPTTYMNLSGKAVNYWLKELKIPVDRMLTVMDDIALPFGRIRIRERGSSAGHNGLANVELSLGSNQYPRLRVGIGDNFRRGQQVDYVLSRFSQEEFDQLPGVLEKASEAVLSFAAIGIERSMNIYNS